MPFDPAEHYRNCQGAVAQMASIANTTDNVLVRNTASWDALKGYLTAIGAGAAAARAEIRAAGKDCRYNPAYLSMLNLASNLLRLEILDLADEIIVDADDEFEMCRDYANAIRDPFDLGTFEELGTVPRHDELAPSPRQVLNRLGAALGRTLSTRDLAPLRQAS